MNEVSSRIFYRIFPMKALELLPGGEDKFRHQKSSSQLKKYSEKLHACYCRSTVEHWSKHNFFHSTFSCLAYSHYMMSVNRGFHALKAQESEILIWVRASGSQLLTRNGRPHIWGQKCSELMKSLARVTSHRCVNTCNSFILPIPQWCNSPEISRRISRLVKNINLLCRKCREN